MERFHNRPAVQWTSRHLAAAEQWVGARLLTGTARFRDASFERAELIDTAVRRATTAVAGRVLDEIRPGVEWLEARDPARELIARLRLIGATRKARDALTRRGTDQNAAQSPVSREVKS
jgi:hypothetical protein